MELSREVRQSSKKKAKNSKGNAAHLKPKQTLTNAAKEQTTNLIQNLQL